MIKLNLKDMWELHAKGMIDGDDVEAMLTYIEQVEAENAALAAWASFMEKRTSGVHLKAMREAFTLDQQQSGH